MRAIKKKIKVVTKVRYCYDRVEKVEITNTVTYPACEKEPELPQNCVLIDSGIVTEEEKPIP